jgi:hypothetical protein
MRRILFLLGFLVVSALSVRADDAAMRTASSDFLKGVVTDLLHDPALVKCFPEARVKDESLRPHERGFGGGGWICEWGYQHDMHLVSTQSGVQGCTPSPQAAFLPAFDSGKPGMVFHIFVTLDHGGDMVSRIENFPILKKPDLMVGFDLQSGGEPADLQKHIEAVIKAHLPAFRRAVGADPGQAGG